MNVIDELLVNQFAQDVVASTPIVKRFSALSSIQKREYIKSLINLIQQSKPKDSDIPEAIKLSGLKITFTPCIMLKKGVETHNLIVISELPEPELIKVLHLFLALFKIAYLRRFIIEKDISGKWWYSDLSQKENVESILNNRIRELKNEKN